MIHPRRAPGGQDTSRCVGIFYHSRIRAVCGQTANSTSYGADMADGIEVCRCDWNLLRQSDHSSGTTGQSLIPIVLGVCVCICSSCGIYYGMKLRPFSLNHALILYHRLRIERQNSDSDRRILESTLTRRSTKRTIKLRDKITIVADAAIFQKSPAFCMISLKWGML